MAAVIAQSMPGACRPGDNRSEDVMKNFIKSLAICSVAVAGLATAAPADELRDMALENFKPLPSTIPAVKDNPITAEKIDLGKALFFDPRLSASGVFSCNSCHNLATGGDDNLETSIGHGW